MIIGRLIDGLDMRWLRSVAAPLPKYIVAQTVCKRIVPNRRSNKPHFEHLCRKMAGSAARRPVSELSDAIRVAAHDMITVKKPTEQEHGQRDRKNMITEDRRWHGLRLTVGDSTSVPVRAAVPE